MKKKLISIIIAAAMTASTAVSVFAADNTTAAGTEVYTAMSEQEKTDFKFHNSISQQRSAHA